MKPLNKKIFFWISGIFIFLVLLALLLPLIGAPIPHARDIRDMSNLRQVGIVLLMKAKEENKFPEALGLLRNDISDEKLLSFLDEKQTSYSRPATYPPDKRAILLARPTEHGMVVFYGDGSTQRYVYRKQKD